MMPGAGRFLAAVRRTIALHSRPVWIAGTQRWRLRFDPARLLRSARDHMRSLLFGQKRHVYRMQPSRPPGDGPRPRIVHLIPNVFVGGSTQLICDLSQGLGHRFEMQIVTAAMPRRAAHTGIRIHRHPMPGHGARLAALLRDLAPDLLHIHYWGSVDQPWYDAAFGAAEALGLPVVQNVNTPVAAHRSAAVVDTIFVSRTVQALSPDVPGRTIYPGIDLARFSPRAGDPPQAFDSVGMVYRLEPDKLDRQALEPLIALVRRRPRTRILVVGDGSLLPHYLEGVRKAGAADNFWFVGAVPYESLPDWYARFRTFVAPVWQESFGQVTPFAMAMGLAVAGYKVGALPEILEDDALLGDSAPSLCAILQELLDDPQRISAVGRKNLHIARQRFSLERMIARYDEVYSTIFDRR